MRPSLDARNQATAALACPDLRTLEEWLAYIATDKATMAFSPDLRSYVTAALERGFLLYSTEGHRILRRFPGSAENPAVDFCFSGDQHHLGVIFQNGQAQIWQVDGKAPALTLGG